MDLERQRQVDLDYLRQAYLIAKDSPDKSTQNGAVIVDSNNLFSLGHIIAWGRNEFPRGVNYSDERLARPLKYLFTEHAERNAIFDAVRKGVSLQGKIIYCPWLACADCGRAIIQAGIKEAIAFSGPERWTRAQGNGAMDWDKSIATALEMFKEAGVNYRVVDGEIGGIEVLFGGQIVRP